MLHGNTFCPSNVHLNVIIIHPSNTSQYHTTRTLFQVIPTDSTMLESWAPVTTAMTKKVNFFGRPPSVDSGAPLGKKVVIQHKCDIMLEEQVCVPDLLSPCFIRRITIYYYVSQHV